MNATVTTRGTWRTRFLKLALLIASTGLALILVEVMLRVLPIGPTFMAVRGAYRLSSDPELGYELVPGAADGTAAISSAGLRDREYPERAALGVFRIAVIGDSVAYGYGVEQHETLSEVLERLLNETGIGSGQRYEVLNFALEGYNSAQIARRLETTGVRFHPDLVVYVYCLNDPEGWDNTLGMMLEQLQPRQRESFESALQHPPSWLQRSRLYQLTAALLHSVRSGKSKRVTFDAPAGESAPFYEALHAGTNEGWQRTQRDIQRIAATTERSGSRLAVVIAPMLLNHKDDRGAYGLALTHGRVRDVMQTNGAIVLDLAPAVMRASASTEARMEIDEWHFSARGHQLAALVMLDFLLRERLLPGATVAGVSELSIRPELQPLTAFIHAR
jgi:lysophospholipase L1-like esterase